MVPRFRIRNTERLEPRLPLDAHLVITEFLAKNDEGLRDQDGDRSDWIEIYNDGENSTELDGWYLTDDADQLDKWKFPNVTVGPQQYLVVYASGKNRSSVGSQLHTNFSLDSNGEYLAIVRPNAESVEFAFSPEFPSQYSDRSFGVPQQIIDTTVIGRNSALKYSVPAVDSVFGSPNWTEVSFDDSRWADGSGRTGIDTAGAIEDGIDTDLAPEMIGVSSTALLRYSFQLSEVESANGLVLRMKYSDGYVAYLNGVEIARDNAPYELTHYAAANDIRPLAFIDEPEETNLAEHLELLQSGENVLAIHALNRDLDHDVFFVDAELRIKRPGNVLGGERFFALSSPGRPNGETSYSAVIDTVDVSTGHGFYEQPQDVTLSSSEPGATIIYTLDGSTPSLNNGIQIRSADAGTPPADAVAIPKTSTLRAIALKDDFLPGPVITNTYIFVDDVLTQSLNGEAPDGWPSSAINGQRLDYGMDPDVIEDVKFASQMRDALLDLPTISLVTDLENLFDPTTGIFVNAEEATGNNGHWERPTSLELIRPDGTGGFQVDAGLRIRGNSSRRDSNAKHGFRLLFRKEYGTSKLDFPLFGSEGVTEFENIDLRGAQTMGWAHCDPNITLRGFAWCDSVTMLRDVLARDTQRDMGQPYTRSRYYHLYLNGHYWGVVQSQERPEASFAESYFGGDKDRYDVIKRESPYQDEANGRIAATDGNLDAWFMLWNLAKEGFKSKEDYYRVQGLAPDGTRDPAYPVLLDIDNLIEYMLLSFYDGDLDGPVSDFAQNQRTNNWFGIRNRNGEEGFRFFIHDAEFTFLSVSENRIGPWSAGETFDQSNPQWLHQQLSHNEDYRLRFADRAHIHLSSGGALAAANMTARLQERVTQLQLGILAESARWGDSNREVPYTKDDWDEAIRHITENFIPQRSAVLLDQLKNAAPNRETDAVLPLFPGIAAPIFTTSDGESSIELAIDGANVLFTLDGSDPRSGTSTVEYNQVIGAGSAARLEFPIDGSMNHDWTKIAFDDAEWNFAKIGIGFDHSGLYDDVIDTDIELQMRGESTGVYARIPFMLDEPEAMNRIQLEMQYDDGFIAYLNGTEVASSNAPQNAKWSSGATRARSTTGDLRESFDVSEYSKLLERENVLAVHGLNRSRSDRDFLLNPQLLMGVSNDDGIAPTAIAYKEPIDVAENRVISARSFQNGQWSAMTRAVFTPTSSPLRISELMYHPLAPTADERNAGFTDDDDFEYIEFVNSSGTETIKLGGISVKDAVEFTFPDIALAPGERIIVARNVLALQQRYGVDLPIVGAYGDSPNDFRLSNGGESIQVTGIVGEVIQEFRYNDTWYPETDGLGRSLQAIDAAEGTAWSTPDGWGTSVLIGGSPGRAKAIVGDSNHDGIFDSSDLVTVFSAAKYEDGIANNATFEEGDWNQDGDFTTSDLVFAFQAGTYVAAVRPFPRGIAAVVDRTFDEEAQRKLMSRDSTLSRMSVDERSAHAALL